MAEPLTMPTYLPYEFGNPDEHGRVPFPDVVLASGYQWANDPENNYPLSGHDDRTPELSHANAVARCMLRPYMHAVYGAQRFVEPSSSDPNRGVINTERWRRSIASFLLRESGIAATWEGDAPKINAVRDLGDTNPTPEVWDLVNVNVHNDGRVRPLGMGEQSPAAMLRVFGRLKTTAWAERLLIIDKGTNAV